MTLAPHHRQLLEASAITETVAAARGYRTLAEARELRQFGFARACAVPGLLIPVHAVDGTVRTYQYRPDVPRLDAKGKPRKYEFPVGSCQVLDVPPAAYAVLGNPAVPLWITEGSRKADSAVSAGLTCISLAGVWSWRGTNVNGGKTALPDWACVALNDRLVALCFDSDATTNPQVSKALAAFTDFLTFKHAEVQVVRLPSGPQGEKVGLDDFLAAHGRAALVALLTASRPRPSTTARPAPSSPPVAPRTLAEVEKAFARWIQDPDPIPTRAVLASYVANRHFTGDPIWLMVVGGSGVGKTERLIPLSAMPDVVMESSISGQAALLSGTRQKERATDATGGLLQKLPPGGGLLLLKDFTSILDMHRDARAEVLAALRELYDGRWDRSIGVDGGRTLTWIGHLGLIAGCTTSIDSAHAVVATMGTRFLLVRLHGNQTHAPSAFRHVGREPAMRDELRTLVRGLLDHLPGRPYEKEHVRERIIALASYVALARSPVDRDQRSDIRLVLDPEAPTRLVKMLTQLWRASGLLGLARQPAWEMVRRVGLDSIPKLRRAVLDYLAKRPSKATTTEVSEAVEHPTTTTRRALEDLTAHHVVVRTAEGAGHPDRWELAAQARSWLDETFPVLSRGAPEDPRSTPPRPPPSNGPNTTRRQNRKGRGPLRRRPSGGAAGGGNTRRWPVLTTRRIAS